MYLTQKVREFVTHQVHTKVNKRLCDEEGTVQINTMHVSCSLLPFYYGTEVELLHGQLKSSHKNLSHHLFWYHLTVKDIVPLVSMQTSRNEPRKKRSSKN